MPLTAYPGTVFPPPPRGNKCAVCTFKLLSKGWRDCTVVMSMGSPP